jgi:hypothetical protein
VRAGEFKPRRLGRFLPDVDHRGPLRPPPAELLGSGRAGAGSKSARVAFPPRLRCPCLLRHGTEPRLRAQRCGQLAGRPSAR